MSIRHAIVVDDFDAASHINNVQIMSIRNESSQ